MKPLPSQVLICTIIIVSSVILVQSANNIKRTTTEKPSSEDTGLLKAEKTLRFLDAAVNSDIVNLLESTSKTFSAIIGPAASVISTATNLLTKDLIQEGLDKIINKADDINLKMDDLSLTIPLVYHSLERKVDKEFREVSLEPKLTALLDAMRPIDFANSDFVNTLSSYQYSNFILAHKLKEYATKFRACECHSNILSSLDGEGKFQESLLKVLLEYGGYDTEETRWSITTMIYILYFTVENYLLREFTLLQTTYELIQKLTGTNEIENLKWVYQTRADYMETFSQFVAMVPDELMPTDFDEHLDLKELSEDKIIRMNNFLQSIYLPAKVFEEPCRECKYNDEIVVYGGCNGTARNCVTVAVSPGQYNVPEICVTYEEKPSYRTYAYVSKRTIFEDFHDTPRCFRPTDSLITQCHICQCICDQHLLANTTRLFYIKPITAPPGNVVTGVRWVEQNYVIFLQIEVGKLRGIGQVIANTVTWQKLPNVTEVKDTDCHALSFNRRSVILNNRKESDGDLVVTGVFFEPHHLGVQLFTQKKRIYDFNNGLLREQIYNSTEKFNDLALHNMLNLPNKFGGLAEKGLMTSNTSFYGFTFVMSSWDFDYQQSTVPYFDASNSTFDLKVPLSDIVFTHYTNNLGYAGYIRPVVRSIDYVYFYFSKKLTITLNINTYIVIT